MKKYLAHVSDLIEGEGVLCKLENLHIALFLNEGHFYATDAYCPHAGAALYEGVIENAAVVCPWHAWKFNLKTGLCEGSEIQIKTYSVFVEEGKVWVEL